MSATQTETYGASPLKVKPKRSRRSKDGMVDLLKAAQGQIDEVDDAMTIRHLFYRLANNVGIIEKTEKAYKNLCQHLSKWRKAGAIPFSAFVDSTRWYYGRTGFDTVEDALTQCASTYRKNYWSNSPYHVEVWTEKETIASLLTQQCAQFGVQVFVCRGFASLSSLYECAEGWRGYIEQGKKVHVLYFGDHDPSGVRIDQNADKALRDHFDVDVTFRRVAVTKEQILEHNLPTRPTKKNSPHAAGFEGDSVEIDAFDTKTLRALVTEAVEAFVDPRELHVLKTAEEEERKFLVRLVEGGTR